MSFRESLVTLVLAIASFGCGSTGIRAPGSAPCTTVPRSLTASDYSPQRNLLAFGYRDGTVELRSPGTRAPETCGAHETSISNLAFSPDGNRLATSDIAGNLAISSIASEKVEFAEQVPGEILGLAWDGSGGKLAVSVNTTVYVYDVVQGSRRHRDLPFNVGAVTFTRDGSRLVVAGSRIVFMKMPTLTPEKQVSFRRASPPSTQSIVPTDMRFSPDGRILAVLMLGGIAFLDLKTDRLDVALGEANWDPIGVRFAPNGKIAVFGRDKLYLGRADAQAAATESEGVPGSITDIEFRRDGSLLVIGDAAAQQDIAAWGWMRVR